MFSFPKFNAKVKQQYHIFSVYVLCSGRIVCLRERTGFIDILSIYINFIYHIDRLSFIVLELDTANGLILTTRYNKFIEFWLINYRFLFETIYPQELAPEQWLGTYELDGQNIKSDIIKRMT